MTRVEKDPLVPPNRHEHLPEFHAVLLQHGKIRNEHLGECYAREPGHSFQYFKGVREGAGPEENPCRVDEVKCDDPGDKARESERSLLPETEGHRPRPWRSPQMTNVHRCSMPESHEKERNENIQEDLRLRHPAPAQGI